MYLFIFFSCRVFFFPFEPSFTVSFNTTNQTQTRTRTIPTQLDLLTRHVPRGTPLRRRGVRTGVARVTSQSSCGRGGWTPCTFRTRCVSLSRSCTAVLLCLATDSTRAHGSSCVYFQIRLEFGGEHARTYDTSTQQI